jgi:hypothetical protein
MARISKTKRQRILLRDGHRCTRCGNGERPGIMGSLQMDHIIPRSKGGTNDDGNLQVMCGACNVHKLDHLPGESLEATVARWCEQVFGPDHCNENLRVRHIRRLLRQLEIAHEYSGAHR